MVETTGYVSAVGIVVADTDRMYVGSMGHNILSKVLVECGNGRGIWRVDGGLSRLPGDELKKNGAMWLVLGSCYPITVHTKEAPTHWSLTDIPARIGMFCYDTTVAT